MDDIQKQIKELKLKKSDKFIILKINGTMISSVCNNLYKSELLLILLNCLMGTALSREEQKQLAETFAERFKNETKFI